MAPLRGTKRRRATRLTMPKKKRKIELVDQMQEEVIAPQEGDHSLAWAQAIVLQPRGLLKLPIEVRNMIYGCLNQWTIISPRKSKKGKFVNRLQYYKAIDTCVTLSQVCKQLFVDITGSGLLYYTNHFLFYTPDYCVRCTNVTLYCYGAKSAARGKDVQTQDRSLAQLEGEIWDMLRSRLLDFYLDFTVSPKMVVLDSRWGFHRSLGICLDTCLHTWDPKIKELVKKIKEVVLKK